MGATWLFNSAANREMFIQDTGKYAPQFGGYCAYGMAHGYAAPIDPAAWTVVGGKLYLNYNLEVRDAWVKSMGKFIAQANQNWPKIPKKTVTH
jgi:hypothetical protein